MHRIRRRTMRDQALDEYHTSYLSDRLVGYIQQLNRSAPTPRTAEHEETVRELRLAAEAAESDRRLRRRWRRYNRGERQLAFLTAVDEALDRARHNVATRDRERVRLPHRGVTAGRLPATGTAP